MFKENFTEEELKKARQNGFILTGQTGAGKSTLLNILFEKEVTETRNSPLIVTKKSQVFYLKLKNGNCISIVDTPGLPDPERISENQSNFYNNHFKGIQKAISDEKIHIKGILFIFNFIFERFDYSQQEALLYYNQIFPLKNFWKHLIVIFSHYFFEPNDKDSPEDIMKIKDNVYSIIFNNLINKVKNISDVIDYKQIRFKYYNSYSHIKNNKQRNNNSKNKEELEIILNDISQEEPLFSEIEVVLIKNGLFEENGQKFLVEYERIEYFDLNHNLLNEKINMIKREKIK